MQIHAKEEIETRKPSDMLVIPCFQEKGKVKLSTKKFGDFLPVDLGDFTAKVGESVLIYQDSKKESRVFLLGLGEKKELNLEKIRQAFGSKSLEAKNVSSLSVFVPKGLDVEAIVEGILLANYRFEKLKTKKTLPDLKSVTLLNVNGTKEAKRAQNIMEGVDLTRDLVNGNADDVTPQYLVKIAKKLATDHPKITTKAFTKKQIEQEKLGLLLAVNKGSHIDPAFMIVEYKGNAKSKDKTVLVGKGITYDTGGLNLKPTGFMETMKRDMAGGGTVLGILKAVALLNLKINVTGVIPSTENTIGSRAYKPGDVYKSYSGKTVEIGNTDAEGRLVLADAISYAVKNLAPSRIIDLATLTGAVKIALGEERAGLFSNDASLVKVLEKSGESSGEKVWHLPTDPEYLELLKSKIADICNASKKRMAGSITAAKFLEYFVEDTPWAHLDIAAVADIDNPKHYHRTLSTGFGVRLVTEMLQSFEK